MPHRHAQRSIALALIAWSFVAVLPKAPAEDAPAGLRHERVAFRGAEYDVVWVDLREADLRLYWRDDKGEAFRNFAKLEQWLRDRDESLHLAVNAGIYARDITPLGLHVEEGVEKRPLNRASGGGNFFLQPNGVFYVDAEGAGVLETEAYAAADLTPRIATQSGPLLAIDGELHPRFIPGSDSLNFRNGVGVARPHEIALVLSLSKVNFHDFGSLFIERLGCDNALYLDGAISGMHAPFAGRGQRGFRYVGILAVATGAARADEEETAAWRE